MHRLPRTLEPEVMDTPNEAGEYDAMDHSEPNTTFVARLAELRAGGRMLDIGTGPGHIAPLVCAAIPGATVVGVDLSRHMLEHAERHRRASPFAGRIDYRLADAKRLEFHDAAFDTVFSNTILHHIPDPRPFLAEAWRVLRPGGAFLIRDLFRPADTATLEHLVDLHTIGCNERQRGLFRDSLHAALTPDELRALVAELGLDGVQVTIDTDRHVSIQKPATR